jgi:hypothetical protein
MVDMGKEDFQGLQRDKCAASHSFPEWQRNNSLFSSGAHYLRYLKENARLPKNGLRMKTMAASTTSGLWIPARAETHSSSARGAVAAQVRTNRRRHITPQAGHALEILGHAIEYLTDEFVYEGAALSSEDHRFQAIQVLMGLNRQVYFECPEAPTLAQRFRSMLRLRAA